MSLLLRESSAFLPYRISRQQHPAPLQFQVESKIFSYSIPIKMVVPLMMMMMGSRIYFRAADGWTTCKQHSTEPLSSFIRKLNPRTVRYASVETVSITFFPTQIGRESHRMYSHFSVVSMIKTEKIRRWRYSIILLNIRWVVEHRTNSYACLMSSLNSKHIC